MNINTKIEGKDKIIATLTASGACKFRKDLKSLKEIKKLQSAEEAIITKKIRAALFPLSIDKLKMIFGTERVGTLKDVTQKILGKLVRVEIINNVFLKSDVFARLAKMDYQKTSREVARRRINKFKDE